MSEVDALKKTKRDKQAEVERIAAGYRAVEVGVRRVCEAVGDGVQYLESPDEVMTQQ